MPCPSSAFDGLHEREHPWHNWLGNINYNVPSFYRPSSLADIVWVLREEQGQRIKAVGTGWSFENIAKSRDVVVDIGALQSRITTLTEPGPGFGALTEAWRHRQSSGESHLIHFEVGITLFRLNQVLDAAGLAMPTLGGSQGQTLAGAISTSTHGGDISLPPFPDLVRAIHLVSIGGQEYWIEPASGPLTENNDLLLAHSSPAPCGDMQIIRDDSLFRAIQVGLGRFGIIYSFVLDVTEKFHLAEWTINRPWSDVSVELAAGVGYDQYAPERSHFGGLTALPAPPGDLDISVSPTQFRYLEVLMNSQMRSNPGNGDNCWVRRRWPTDERSPINLESSANPLCHSGVSFAMLSTTAAHLHGLAAGYAASLIFAWKAPFVTAHATRLQHMALDPHMSGGKALYECLNAVWDSQLFGELNWFVPALNQMILSEQFSKSSGEGIRGPSWQVMAGLENNVENDCFRANSIEIVFGLETRAYIDFVDTLLDEAGHYRQAGYITLRFSQRSNATLSMHNVPSPKAVSIEVASLAGLADSVNWLEFVERIAIDAGGRPHWGQQNRLTRSQVETLYGTNNVLQWREQLMRLTTSGGGAADDTFSNNYTAQRGLEPVNLIRRITGVRREGGKITHLCAEEAYWSPIPVEEAIRHILSGIYRYFVSNGASDNAIIVRQFLTTAPDTSVVNNLDNLPIADRLYDDPPSDLRDRQVTSVIKYDDMWETIRFVCNDEEEWMVPIGAAFFHITSGTYRYHIVDPETGDRTAILTRQFLTTRPDHSTENNLEALPDC